MRYIKEFTKKGKKSARALIRAHVLLLTHKGEKEMKRTEILNISRATVSNVKKDVTKKVSKALLKRNQDLGSPKSIPKGTKQKS